MNYTTGLVSIVTPAYNAASTISDTIQSVISQSYTNWEMIVVDDCSTDNTAEIVKHNITVDKRIKYFKTDSPSHGPTVPRNIAIEKAEGQYIAFLDADDIWLPKKLEHQIPLLSAEKRISVVFSDYEKFSDLNDIGVKERRIIKAPSNVTFKMLLKGNCIGNLTGMYDVSQTGKVFLQKTGHEDYVLWLTILRNNFYAENTQTIEAQYRQNTKSVSGNKIKALKWTWNIYHGVLGFGYFKSLYYFSFYALKGFFKFIK